MAKISEILAAKGRKAADIETVAQKPRFGKRPRIGQAPDMERVRHELEEAKVVAEDVRDFRKEIFDEISRRVKARLEICRMIESGENRDEEKIFSTGLQPQLKEIEKDLGEILEATFPYREPVLVAFGAAMSATESESELEWGIQVLCERGFLNAVEQSGFFRFKGKGYNLGSEFNGSQGAIEVMSEFRKLSDRFHKKRIEEFLANVTELKKKAGPNPVLPNEIGKREGLGYIYVPREETPDGQKLADGWILFKAEDRIQPVDCFGRFDRIVNEMIESGISVLAEDIGREKLSEYIPSKERFRLTFIFSRMIARGIAAFPQFQTKGYYDSTKEKPTL